MQTLRHHSCAFFSLSCLIKIQPETVLTFQDLWVCGYIHICLCCYPDTFRSANKLEGSTLWGIPLGYKAPQSSFKPAWVLRFLFPSFGNYPRTQFSLMLSPSSFLLGVESRIQDLPACASSPCPLALIL